MVLKVILFIVIILIVLYFLAIMPRMIGKPSSDDLLKQNLYAHRGLHDNSTDAPENSMAAFKKAVDEAISNLGIKVDELAAGIGWPDDYPLVCE